MKNIAHIFSVFLAVLLCFGILLSVKAQSSVNSFPLPTSTASASIFNDLLRDEILELNLAAPLHTLIKKKAIEEKYPATLSYRDKKGQKITQSIKVRTRGNMRKTVCGLPPVKFYFPKKQLTANGYNKAFNDYKLVLRCRNGEKYDNYVLKEYLAYKLLNILTEYSFRVQLIRLNIEDTDGKKDPVETYGFIIENKEELAHRLNGEIIKPAILSPRGIEPKFYDLMAVFQYMIGNTDWYMYNQHNLKVLKSEDFKFAITIPYDFDYAGMVGTPYATPHEKLPISTVKNRYFLGQCRDTGDYEATLQLFRDKKMALLGEVEQFDLLDAKTKAHTLAYLKSFFEILENPKKTRKEIIAHCGLHISVE